MINTKCSSSFSDEDSNDDYIQDRKSNAISSISLKNQESYNSITDKLQINIFNNININNTNYSDKNIMDTNYLTSKKNDYYSESEDSDASDDSFKIKIDEDCSSNIFTFDDHISYIEDKVININDISPNEHLYTDIFLTIEQVKDLIHYFSVLINYNNQANFHYFQKSTKNEIIVSLTIKQLNSKNNNNISKNRLLLEFSHQNKLNCNSIFKLVINVKSIKKSKLFKNNNKEINDTMIKENIDLLIHHSPFKFKINQSSINKLSIETNSLFKESLKNENNKAYNLNLSQIKIKINLCNNYLSINFKEISKQQPRILRKYLVKLVLINIDNNKNNNNDIVDKERENKKITVLICPDILSRLKRFINGTIKDKEFSFFPDITLELNKNINNEYNRELLLKYSSKNKNYFITLGNYLEKIVDKNFSSIFPMEFNIVDIKNILLANPNKICVYEDGFISFDRITEKASEYIQDIYNNMANFRNKFQRVSINNTEVIDSICIHDEEIFEDSRFSIYLQRNYVNN